MVGNEIDPTPKTKTQLDGAGEPKPITYIGGPLSGQRRADRREERQVVTVNGQDEVYWRLKLEVGDGTVMIPVTVMAYQGPLAFEAIPEIIKRHAARMKNKQSGDKRDGTDDDGGAAIA